MNDINILLNSFPKTRPPLGSKIRKIYESHYKSNRNGETPFSNFTQYLERWMRVKIASSNKNNLNTKKNTLEIGAGTLNQLPYEVVGSDSIYDVIEPMDYLYKDSPYLGSITNIYNDIKEIPNTKSYDRIISIVTLEHIIDLPLVIKESIKRLKDGGIFSCGIPSEGGLLWGLSWRISTGLEFRIKYNADYGELMRHEHVNDAEEIEALLKYFFKDVKIRTFGLGTHFSLYKYIECSHPNKSLI